MIFVSIKAIGLNLNLDFAFVFEHMLSDDNWTLGCVFIMQCGGICLS